MMKTLRKEKKEYHRYIDPEVKDGKSILPFAIFLVILFLAAYLFFNNVFFG